MKSVYIYAAMLGASFALNSGTASAQKYDKRVSNPFIFCSAPKPCKLCQPFRSIHEDICAGQDGTSKEEDPNPPLTVPAGTPDAPRSEPENEPARRQEEQQK